MSAPLKASAEPHGRSKSLPGVQSENAGLRSGPPGPNIVLLASNWSDAEEIANRVDRLLSFDKTVVLVMPC